MAASLRSTAIAFRHFRVQRSFSTLNTTTLPEVTLYQYAICPFCHKSKALLSYVGLSPTVVEVNPLTKVELKPWSGDYRKVPIAIIDGEQINGSDEIVNKLLESPSVQEVLQSKWSDMSMEEFTKDDTWSKFAHEDLAALIYPNLCSSLGSSYQAFGYVSQVPNFSPIQKSFVRTIGSFAMYMAASKIKSKRGITDERQALKELLSKFETEALDNGSRKFVSGKDDPSLGDITVYGTLRSVEGLQVHEEFVTGALADWYRRTKETMA